MRTESLADAGDSVLEPVQQGHPENTSSMMDSSGELAAAYEYDEFGNMTIRAEESFDNEICYTGQVYDQSTGLYYYKMRAVSSIFQHFLHYGNAV